ncbi:MAG: Gx transporter family protein [Clostridia bacterium]|nr:Gx transporter family protein [Clostridia bacterium]MBR2926538.1 Gx transporter family protein [Clostridia bacterium]
MKTGTKKLTALALTISFAMILSYIESRLPTFVAVPGIKIGLANIAVIFSLYKFGIKESLTVSIIRIVLISLLFGSPISMLYGLAGGILSLVAMILLKRFTPLKEVAISVCGGVLHNVGQIGMASILLSTNVILYYLPFLLLSGTVAGIVVGIVSALLIKRIRI